MDGKINNLSYSDLRLLNIFKTVVECNGITAAQEVLGKNKATISIALSDIETRLGFSLCQRGRAGFKLSPEGEIVFHAYSNLHKHIVNFSHMINSINDSIHGSLRVYIVDNLINHQKMLITDTLKKVRRQYPNLNIHLVMGGNNEAKGKLLHDETDVAILHKTVQDSGLSYIDLYQEKEYLYISTSNSILDNESHFTVQQVMQLPTVRSSYSYGIDWDLYNTKATTNDREATAFLILTGEYSGYLPSFYAKQWVDAQRIKPIKPNELNNDIDYCIAVKASRSNDRFIKIWLDCFNVICEQHASSS